MEKFIEGWSYNLSKKFINGTDHYIHYRRRYLSINLLEVFVNKFADGSNNLNSKIHW